MVCPFSLDHITYPRHITEGALALQYVVANGRVEQAVERFGSISGNGKRVTPPTKTFGAIWEDTPAAHVVLYCTRLGSGQLCGMIFTDEFKEWFRLENLRWNEGSRTLTFTHTCPAPIGERRFQLTVAENMLRGSYRQGDADYQWQATKLAPFGLWTSESVFGRFLLRHMEGEYDRWLGKLLQTTPLQTWQRLDFVEWDGETVKFGWLLGDFVTAQVDGNRMTGTLAQRRYRAEGDVYLGDVHEIPWEAARAPDELPF
jgi:hypothetical protein